MPTAKSFRGRQYHGPEVHTITLSAANPAVASNNTVTFDVAYPSVPEVLVVPPLGIGGTWSASSITKTGFTISVSSEDHLIDGITVDVVWFAAERT